MTRSRISRTPFLMGRLFFLAFLALGIAELASPNVYGDDPNKLAQDKKIQEIEKEIERLRAELVKLRSAPAAADPIASYGAAMQWRCVGPANMGGRITAIAVFEQDPSTYWAATASGGLIKTVNNGSNFEHQFDHEATVSIGAVAVAPSDKNIVWVGTGEANPRNSVSYGDGIYKSTDGGKTWTNMGLKKSYQIGSVVIHPKNPDIVYVAALGRLYGPSEERGVYKTTDGGKTWNRIHYIDDKTGALEIVIKPNDPESLIVATWERSRDEFDSFRGEAKGPEGADEYAPNKLWAPGTGIFRTTDGGKTFTKLTKGLPKANMGRIGLEYSRKNPNTIFATIDTEKAGGGNPPTQIYMGVQGDEEYKGGAKLTGITEKGPAEKSGLKVGDIITKFGDKEIKKYEDMRALIPQQKIGEKIKLEVTRGTEKKTIDLVLEGRPIEGAQQRGGGGGGRRPVTFGVTNSEPMEGGGLKVVEVRAGSSAAKAGIKPEDVMLTIDGSKLTDTKSLFVTLVGKKAGDKIKLNYKRGDKATEVELVLEDNNNARPGRPNAGAAGLGGQRPNVQDFQGPEGNDTGGIYKSEDNGETWKRINSLNERPFYFSVIRQDPSDEKVLLSAGVTLYISHDGGVKFTNENVNKGVHSDIHAIWINPRNGKHMMLGTDGGIYVSYDQGANWEHLNTMAMGQFYHVTTDNRKPYRVYGGLQDNGSWGGPSETNRLSGPSNEDFLYLNGGDGFVMRVDPVDPDIVYAESQDGMMTRKNLKTGGGNFIRPRAVANAGNYRFNWNTPFIISVHNPSIFYSAGNYVFKSIKRGDDQKIFSPEITLTKRGSGTALCESPVNPDIVWVGTDDGAVQLTKDGGKTWTNVSDKFKAAGLPGPRWVASIEASKAKDGRAYVCFDAHRSNDDDPYIFVTEDFGTTWTSLRANLPMGSSRVLREDVTNPNVLYLGTEFGAWVSINRGKSWTKINGKSLPTVAVHEFAQPAGTNDLVVATHGRSIWITDVAALRQVSAESLSTKTSLYKPSNVIRWQLDLTKEGMFSTGTRRFVGTNSSRSANIEYHLAKKPEKIALSLIDINGKNIRTLTPTKDVGFNRVSWDLRQMGAIPRGMTAEQMAGSNFGNRLLEQTPAGSYRVVLTVDGTEYSQVLTIENDPNTGRSGNGVDELAEERKMRKLMQGTQKGYDDPIWDDQE